MASTTTRNSWTSRGVVSSSEDRATGTVPAIGSDRIWPSDRFFEAKLEEQKNRYRKYDDTVSSLEPNLKEGPGGLRDIQTVDWVVKRHLNANRMSDLVKHGFLTETEYWDLKSAQEWLWRIRFALHLHTGRCEDRNPSTEEPGQPQGCSGRSAQDCNSPCYWDTGLNQCMGP